MTEAYRDTNSKQVFNKKTKMSTTKQIARAVPETSNTLASNSPIKKITKCKITLLPPDQCTDKYEKCPVSIPVYPTAPSGASVQRKPITVFNKH